MTTISQNLSDRYNAFITKARPWDFFMGLANYLEYVLTTPSLKKVVDEQVAIRDAEYAEIARLEEASANEFREAWKQLMAIVAKHSLDVSTFTAFTSAIPTPPGRKMETIPEQMQASEEGSISMSGFHSDHLEHFVFDIAANLLKLGYEKELGEYVVTVPQAAAYFARVNGRPDSDHLMYGGNTYGNFIFSKTWPERFAKVRSVERAREHKPWGAFDDLLKFWQARQEFLAGSGFFETMHKVATTEYKFGGKDALDVAWGVKDLEAMEENRDIAAGALHFLRVEDFRTRAPYVAGAVMGSLPENNTPEAKAMARARTRAIEKVRDKYWRKSVDEHMKRVEDFLEKYEFEHSTKEAGEVAEEKWWPEGATPTYDAASRQIILADRKCQISHKAQNQGVLCQFLFARRLGDWVEEHEVIGEFYRGDNSRRSLYDTARAINTEILQQLKIHNLLEHHPTRRVRIRKEVFTKE